MISFNSHAFLIIYDHENTYAAEYPAALSKFLFLLRPLFWYLFSNSSLSSLDKRYLPHITQIYLKVRPSVFVLLPICTRIFLYFNQHR